MDEESLKYALENTINELVQLLFNRLGIKEDRSDATRIFKSAVKDYVDSWCERWSEIHNKVNV